MKIQSYTLKQLDDNNDLFFLHRGAKLTELSEPELLYCYANTIVLQEKSAEYACRIASTFRDILVYMRPWCYESLGLKECVIYPLFDLNSTTWNILDCPDLPELPRI